jgi:hypothetical protein
MNKAVWSTAFINDLPDIAFAVVLPGGKKDADGKTVPRSLRMLPHHNASVKSPTEHNTVDLPHLRNGLARIGQAKMPEDAKRRAQAHLDAHAKELLATRKPSPPKETNMENKEARIQVAKTALPLGPNQALDEFRRELFEGLKPHLAKTLKLQWESTEQKAAHMYTKDIFGDHVVVEVHQWAKGKGGIDNYWLVPYARGPGGMVFGDPVEVVKEIRYVPKMPVTKRAEPSGGIWSNVL